MNKTIGAVVLATSLEIGANYYAHSQEIQKSQASANMMDKSDENKTYNSEFAPIYWIPVYGAAKAAFNFRKRESAFHDVPQDLPNSEKVKRTCLKLGWFFYHGISCLAVGIGILRGIKGLEKLLNKKFSKIR